MRRLSPSFWMMVLSAAVLTAFFILPRNSRWWNDRVVNYARDLPIQLRHMDIEYRKADRWETAYTVSKEIAALFRSRSYPDTAYFLLPPSAYFRQHGINYKVPEPAVFYYYTGLRSTMAQDSMAPRSAYVVVAEKGQLDIVSLPNDSLLRFISSLQNILDHP